MRSKDVFIRTIRTLAEEHDLGPAERRQSRSAAFTRSFDQTAIALILSSRRRHCRRRREPEIITSLLCVVVAESRARERIT